MSPPLQADAVGQNQANTQSMSWYRHAALMFRGRHRRFTYFLFLLVLGIVVLISRDDISGKNGEGNHSKYHFSNSGGLGDAHDFYGEEQNGFERRDLQMKVQMANSFGVTDTRLNLAASHRSDNLHILILASQRSGSSFLGEIFKQNSDVFYAFEPVRPLTFAVLKGALKPNEFDAKAKEIMYDFFTCRNATLRLVKRRLNKADPVNIKHVDLTSVCRTKKHVAIKEIRLYNIEQLQTFAENPALNFKIINLVRDPRAVMNSRSQAYFTNHDFKRKSVPWDEVTDLCLDMKNNLNLVYSPPNWLRGKYMLVRYEDLASRPLQSAKEIYDFVGMPLPNNVINWIYTHTQTRRGGALSTTRNSTERISAWKTEMAYKDVADVQKKCSEVMEKLGYRAVSDEYNMQTVNITLVDDSTNYFTFPYIL